MTKFYLSIIALSWLFIAVTAPYTYESVRHHIAEEVTTWPEAQASYSVKERDQIENVLAVAMPPMKGITE